MEKVPVYSMCCLCGVNPDLRRSHIFPKFYWDWMKRTGDGYFRDATRPNQRIQDGVKLPMLCERCETRFSRVETPFATKMFEPLVMNASKEIRYEQYAHECLLSILWRNLRIDLDSKADPKREFGKSGNQLRDLEAEWRGYLLGERGCAKTPRIHWWITDFSDSESPQYNLYLTRWSDATPVWVEDQLWAYYCKFSRFVVCAEVQEFDQSEWVGSRVDPDGGLLVPGSIELRGGHFVRFLISRAHLFEDIKKQTVARMSQTQRLKIRERTLANIDHLRESEYGRAFVQDYQWSSSIPKASRNDPCPCGSGLKYKKCHGRWK